MNTPEDAMRIQNKILWVQIAREINALPQKDNVGSDEILDKVLSDSEKISDWLQKEPAIIKLKVVN